MTEPETPLEEEGWHGTVNGYMNHKCRCGPCRKAWREYPPRRAAQRRWREKVGITKPKPAVPERRPEPGPE